MPTLILIDNSLSMCKNVLKDLNQSKFINKYDLTNILIKELINSIKNYDIFETIALGVMSPDPEIIIPFTKDFEIILNSLEKIKIGNRINFEKLIDFTNDYIISEYGCFTHIEIILITDGIDSLNDDLSSIKYYCEEKKLQLNYLKEKLKIEGENQYDDYKNELLNNDFKFPFQFPNNINFIVIKFQHEVNEEDVDNNDYYYNELIKLNNDNGKLFNTKNVDIDINLIIHMFKNICNIIYKKFKSKLTIGHLECNVSILPPPKIFVGYQYHAFVNRDISRIIEVLGFISISDLIIPQIFSKHLILPLNEDEKTNVLPKMLHYSLKNENMGSIVRLAEDWFGYIFNWIDSKNDVKKKSNLILSIFVPGEDILLNALSKIYPKPHLKLVPPLSNILQEPIQRQVDVKSYAKNCIVWLKQNNLVSDMQKIIRNAKKIPEKITVFYKELNKIRRAALSFGFYELFEGMAEMLEREVSTITNPEAVIQIHHTIRSLKSHEYKDYKNDILPHILKSK